MGLALFTFQNHVFNPTFVVGAFVSFGAQFIIQKERERCLIPNFCFSFKWVGLVFFSQSSFIFKRGCLPCSSAFAGYFKKLEILFPAFLLIFFPLSSLLLWASKSAAAGTHHSVWLWCQCQALSCGTRRGFAKGGLPGLAIYFLFSLLVHLVNPEKKPFFGQTAQLQLQ